MLKFSRYLFRSNKIRNIPSISTSKKDSKNSNLYIVLSCSIFGSIIGAAYFYKRYKFKELENKMQINKEIQMSTGLPSIGGDFNLMDYNGNKVSLNDFRGKWMLIYFGFCNCPDVCPDQIEKIIMVVERLGMTKNVPKIQPVFVSVDPDRDTPEILKNYLKEFSEKILGLTGTKTQIEAITKAYRIYYSMGPKDQFGDYIVDHAIIMYLIGPQGEFVEYYGQNKSVPDICKSIQQHMKDKQAVTAPL